MHNHNPYYITLALAIGLALGLTICHWNYNRDYNPDCITLHVPLILPVHPKDTCAQLQDPFAAWGGVGLWLGLIGEQSRLRCT